MAPTRPAFGAFVPILALTRMEWRIGWRTPTFRLAVIGALLFGLSVGGEAGRGVALSAYSTAEAACRIPRVPGDCVDVADRGT